MSAVAFDNTMLSALLNPSGKPLRIPGTEIPIDYPKERAEGRVAEIAKENRKIILPTPACAELLTAIGPDAQQLLLPRRLRPWVCKSHNPQGGRDG